MHSVIKTFSAGKREFQTNFSKRVKMTTKRNLKRRCKNLSNFLMKEWVNWIFRVKNKFARYLISVSHSFLGSFTTNIEVSLKINGGKSFISNLNLKSQIFPKLTYGSCLCPMKYFLQNNFGFIGTEIKMTPFYVDRSSIFLGVAYPFTLCS